MGQVTATPESSLCLVHTLKHFVCRLFLHILQVE